MLKNFAILFSIIIKDLILKNLLKIKILIENFYFN